jgi:guanylate kinase
VITAKKKFPEIKSIYITASSLDILEQRIRRRNRGVSEEYLQERLTYTKEWMNHEDIYDYKVVNEEGKLDETIEKVSGIIKRITKKSQGQNPNIQ